MYLFEIWYNYWSIWILIYKWIDEKALKLVQVWQIIYKHLLYYQKVVFTESKDIYSENIPVETHCESRPIWNLFSFEFLNLFSFRALMIICIKIDNNLFSQIDSKSKCSQLFFALAFYRNMKRKDRAIFNQHLAPNSFVHHRRSTTTSKYKRIYCRSSFWWEIVSNS